MAPAAQKTLVGELLSAGSSSAHADQHRYLSPFSTVDITSSNSNSNNNKTPWPAAVFPHCSHPRQLAALAACAAAILAAVFLLLLLPALRRRRQQQLQRGQRVDEWEGWIIVGGGGGDEKGVWPITGDDNDGDGDDDDGDDQHVSLAGEDEKSRAVGGEAPGATTVGVFGCAAH